MKRKYTYIALVVMMLSSIGLFSLNADHLVYTSSFPELEAISPQNPDTLPSRYPVAKTVPENYIDDIKKKKPMDLRDPDNVTTTIDYDIRTGTYLIRTKIGDMEIGTPMSLTPEEYQNHSLQESLRSYFRQKNDEEFLKEADKTLNLTDLQFDLGPAERIFGPGGVRVRTQGSAEITMGLKQNKTKNQTLPVRAQNRTFFNFDENVQLNVQASVGNKVSFDMNYNTETTFDFDSKKLKLAYTGEEDEIIKTLEAGNVSMTTNNSLINGGAALFGIKADLQFGKLRVNTILAQQESESKTVNSKGGVQTTPFEITADNYDENRHFFLAHYFRDTYDESMSTLPHLNTPININTIEVWITNKRGSFDQARNIVAFTDLAEYKHIGNPGKFTPRGSLAIPLNEANTLYDQMKNVAAARNSGTATGALNGEGLIGGTDYEKIESARLLSPSEYTVNKQLGYISLTIQLQPDEVLAVAYNYEYRGQVYQVGEFSNNNTGNTSDCLYVKLLKGTTMSPEMMFWDLMMKNVYSLNAYSVQSEKFRMDVLYQSDTTGIYMNYLSEGDIANKLLLRVMNLDNLDSKNERYPDGIFDFVEGSTILSENGKIIFPVVEPFGSHLAKMIGNPAIAEKYVFQELYDTTLTVARQIAEKNKFILRGEFKASSGAEIDLGATNVARGSVRVTAGGVALTENVDYIVDYTLGRVTIMNEGVIASNQQISVSLENQSTFNMQRKTLLGADVNYDFSKDFSIGATIMHMSEMPLTVKTSFGDESLKNTLWGLNASYKGESQWLTNILDKLPLLTLTQPSQISFNAQFAHLIAGHYENEYTGGYSYLDDFESTQNGFDLMSPYSWNLASTPSGMFKEDASYINDVRYGRNRAQFAWYYVDGIFWRSSSSQMPSYIKNNKSLYSDHHVRSVEVRELFPKRELQYNEENFLPILNLAYYPNERGPYNLNYNEIDNEGFLTNPERRWGGMMRKIDQTDFESANIEYIEFWIMDPFIKKKNSIDEGGDLYFNLGEISEDILKDEKKFFENGLPVDGDASKVEFTNWGKVPAQQSTVYAFDNTTGTRALQDVGFNGLSSAEERTFGAYKEMLDNLSPRLPGEVLQRFEDDPAGDNFMHFRDVRHNNNQASILDRYKYYNGTEGNSAESTGRDNLSSRNTPDVEDLNNDNTMNENERYFEYKIPLRRGEMEVGRNFIVNIDTAKNVKLADGNVAPEVIWYQYKIPLQQPTRTEGNIKDFKTIRFMRTYMTGFRDTTILRFAKFELVRGEWRTYTQALYNSSTPPVGVNTTLDVSSVNLEENSGKSPVNYVLPPGVTRMIDPGQPQITQQNEQSLSMKITNLASQDARAVYKNTSYDLRQYKRMQLFTHAEAFLDDVNLNAMEKPQNGDLSVFIRLGSDYKNNYYEYEIPLTLTPHGEYRDNPRDREMVWPFGNTMNFRFEALTDLKLKRNRLKREGTNNVNFMTPYSEPDPDNSINRISIVGNPSLSEVKVIMIGVRNNSHGQKNVEVWVNELRLTDFNEDGGWAANANLNIALSDLGTVNVGGRIETAGFGGLDQSLNERRLDDFTQYNVAANFELGKFFPEKAKVSIPVTYMYSKEFTDPKYNPLDQDILLKDAVDEVETKAEKDSILSFARERMVNKSISLNGIRADIRSKTPMPYDPGNFTFGYSYSESTQNKPDTEYETTKDYRGNFAYNYSPYAKPFQPFAKIKKSDGSTRLLKQLSINYLPSSISFQTAMVRNYYELQLRDVSGSPYALRPEVSFSQNFLWDRAFSLNWNFTNNMRATFSSGTNARIEEPHVQVNKKLAPDAYVLWKDSVKQSIADLGTPMAYDQKFNLSYALPLQSIPVLDWINSTATYDASYNWDRGARLDETIEIGNTIRNQRQIDLQGGLNIVNLYNKNKFLKSVNQKLGTTTTTRATTTPTNRRNTNPRQRRVEKEVQLSPDSGVVVEHGLLTKKLSIRAVREDGKAYRIQFKPVNYATIRIENKDSVKLKLTILPGPPKTEMFWYKAAEHTTRFLMMVRRINIQYTLTDGMVIPGFRPEIGDIFGQDRMGGVFAPGLDFAFGGVNRSYIDNLANRDWLVMSQTNINPALINSARNLTISMNLEPITGLKIDLRALRSEINNSEIKYMYDGMPETNGGTFMMTTMALGSAFEGMGSLENNYASKTFDKFLDNRATITSRLEDAYAGTNYPNQGFIAGSSLAGNPYSQGGIDPNSTDVLVPAFLAAYTGGDANSISLTAFPSLAKLLPNWGITYDGLLRIPVINKYFKSVLLNHRYSCTYNVGSFSSFLGWVDAGQDGLGYVKDVLTGNPLPSSQYNISAVSLNEAFSPLFGVEGTLLSNVTLSTEYRKQRNLNLNISSYQLVETHTKEIIIGVGYKYANFNTVLKRRPSKDFNNDLTVQTNFSLRKNQSLIRKIEEETAQATSGNLAKAITFSADYGLSRALTIRAFYDMQINEPLVSSASYPTTNSSYGVSLRFSLAQ